MKTAVITAVRSYLVDTDNCSNSFFYILDLTIFRHLSKKETKKEMTMVACLDNMERVIVTFNTNICDHIIFDDH